MNKETNGNNTLRKPFRKGFVRLRKNDLRIFLPKN